MSNWDTYKTTNPSYFPRVGSQLISSGGTPTRVALIYPLISSNAVTGYNIVDGGAYGGTPTFTFSGGGSGVTPTPTMSGGAVVSMAGTGGTGFNRSGVAWLLNVIGNAWDTIVDTIHTWVDNVNGAGFSLFNLGSATWVGGASLANSAALVAASASITNTTTLTAFSKALTIQAGSINYLGAAVRLRAAGLYSSAASSTLTVTLAMDGIGFAGFNLTLPAISNCHWSLEAELHVRSTGTSATLVFGHTVCCFGAVVVGTYYTHASGTISAKDLTVAHGIELYAQWGAASASDVIIMDTFTSQILPAFLTVS